MKRLLALALLLAPASSLARSGPTISGLRTPGYCLGYGSGSVALCALQGPVKLAMPVILAGGFTAPPAGSGAWSGDTYTPSSGTFTVTGNLDTSGIVKSDLIQPHTGGGNILFRDSNGTSLFRVNSTTGGLEGLTTGQGFKPDAGSSGAATLIKVIRNTYVIDFGAFAGGGAAQSSAQAMTGLAFGDGCVVGADGDTSAEFAGAFVEVTSAGNFKLVITPLTAAGTVNPASHTYTVTCLRSL